MPPSERALRQGLSNQVTTPHLQSRPHPLCSRSASTRLVARPPSVRIKSQPPPPSVTTCGLCSNQVAHTPRPVCGTHPQPRPQPSPDLWSLIKSSGTTPSPSSRSVTTPNPPPLFKVSRRTRRLSPGPAAAAAARRMASSSSGSGTLRPATSTGLRAAA